MGPPREPGHRHRRDTSQDTRRRPRGARPPREAGGYRVEGPEIDCIQFPDQAGDEDGRHSRRARAAAARAARLRAMARTAPARGARCEPNRTRAGTHPPAQNNARSHGQATTANDDRTNRNRYTRSAATPRERLAAVPKSTDRHARRTQSAAAGHATHEPVCGRHPNPGKDLRAGADGPARPGASQRDRRASSAAREADRRPTKIARGATTRAQASVRVRGSFTQGPSRSPRLARVRRPARRHRARRDASRFADPCRSATPTSRYDHRRGNRHEPSSITDRRPAEVAGTRAGPQGCPG